jgi:RNA polymerase sigma-70 factor (ECF subfamily)
MDDELEEAVAVFVRVRPRLLGIAYRIVGSTTEAEDVVQEVWLRWQRTDRTAVANPHAFLATVATRLAINVSQSARRRRETCVGPWFPEPATSADDDPAADAERGEAVELAVLLLLGKLTPRERAAYVLREAFGYPYRQISEMLHLHAANTRQLVSRAHGRLATDGHQPVTPSAHQHLLHAFLTAARAGELQDLEELLTAEAG